MIAGHASSDRGTTVKQLQVTATFPRIPSDNLGEFKRMAGEALKVTADDPGVSQYDWFFNEDESKCVVRETYADSDAQHAEVRHVPIGRAAVIRGVLAHRRHHNAVGEFETGKLDGGEQLRHWIPSGDRNS